jgi:hypothetical protein
VISDAFWLAAANGLFLAAGAGATGAFGWWRGVAQLRRSLGIAFLCGVALYGVAAQLLYVLGASMSVWEIVLVCGLFALGATRGLAARDSAHAAPRPAWPRWPALALAAFVALIAVDLWYQPLWAIDSWTFWTPKAHALWALNGLDAHWFTQANLISPDYPILLPSIEAAGFHLSGYETGLLDIQSLLFVVAFLHAIYNVHVRRSQHVVVWAVLAMLVTAPSVIDQLAAAQADIPVAVLFATSGMCGALWLRDRRGSALAVAAVLAAGACATKVEGIAFAVAIFAALALTARAWLPLAAGSVAIATGVVPWRLWLANHHVANQGSYVRLTSLGYLGDHLARIPIAIGYLLAKMADPRAWLLLLPLALVALVDAYRRGERALPTYVAVTALLAFGGLVLAYWSSRLGFRHQLVTSDFRVVTGILFFCAAVTPQLTASLPNRPCSVAPDERSASRVRLPEPARAPARADRGRART